MNIRRSIVLILALLILPACDIGSEYEALDLDGTSWKLVSYDGNSPIEGKVMTAHFKNGEINGSASCNHYFGSYKIKGDQIKVEGLGWTEMACLDPEGIMEQEQAVMSMLGDARTVSLQTDSLEIRTSTGKILLFSPHKE